MSKECNVLGPRQPRAHRQRDRTSGTIGSGTYCSGTYCSGTYCSGTYCSGTHCSGTHHHGIMSSLVCYMYLW
jgi:hypothetical protein